MATQDIQRLRQQAMFNVAPQLDIMGGGGGGMGYTPEPEPMNYAARGPMGGIYQPPPIENERPQAPNPFELPPSTGPTFPSGSPILPGQTPADPNKQAAGSTPLAGMTLDEYIAAVNKGYTPDFTDRDRLRKLMDTVPERGKPSLARSIVAAAMSTKAEDPVKMADQVQYAPFYREKADWLSKTEPFYKTADLENRQNVNERTLMTNAITAKTNADRVMEQARQADQKAEIARQKNENDAIRARAYAAKNNGYTVMKAGDRIIAVDPATNRRMDLGPSGGLDRETELDIMGEWGVKQAEARGAAAVQTAQAGAIANNRDVVTIDGITYQRNADGSFVPSVGLPKGTPTRPGTPPRTTGAGARTNTLETRRQIQDEMKERYQTDPSSKKYITQKAGGVYDWKPRPVPAPAGIFPWSADEVTEADVAEYDALRKEVDPSYTPPVAKPGIGGSNSPTVPGGRGGGPGLGPTTTPGGGRGANPSGANTPNKTVTKREYSPSRNQTRITYSDGSTSIVAGKQ